MQTIAIVGKSKVGQALAKAIRSSSKYKLSTIISSRIKQYPMLDTEVIIIAAKDDAIEDVARKAVKAATGRLRLILHVSGSRASTILPERNELSRLTLHPIQTFSKPDVDLLHGIYWMASSDNPATIRWGRQFVADIGGKGMIVLPAESIPLYHAMTVFAANFITLLGGAIEEMIVELDENPKRMKAALRPLMERSLANVLANPASKVLTGPIARKDLGTIKAHLKALKTLDPNLAKVYSAFLKFWMNR
jgi:predicted short-subunit dehydrogenase-like oxidoreductase (DUF2520 family)